MLKITDFDGRGGVDRLVYFAEEIWGTLHPDCGPNDLEAIEEEAAVVIAERDRLRRELDAAQRMIAELRNESGWVAVHERLSKENAVLLEARTVAQEDAQRLRHELEEAKAELARMRPVVEAVVEYVSSGMRERWPVLRAVEAYRASAGREDE